MPGLNNTWKTTNAVIDDVMTNWDTVFEQGIVPNTYYGDLKQSLGGISDSGTTAGASPGSVQGAWRDAGVLIRKEGQKDGDVS